MLNYVTIIRRSECYIAIPRSNYTFIKYSVNVEGVSMSLNISNVSVKTQNPNFRGNYRETKNGNPYYSTNSAAIAGGILAVPAFIHQYSFGKTNSKIASSKAKELENFLATASEQEKERLNKIVNLEKLSEYYKKVANTPTSRILIPAILASGLTLGCGLIVNRLRNKNAQMASDEIRYKGSEQAPNDNKNIKISENGNLYYKSNDGKRIGTLLGLGTGATFMGVNRLLNTGNVKEYMDINKQSIENIFKNGTDSEKLKTGLNKIYKSTASLTTLILLGGFMLGGFIMGAIADSAANKKARKNA